VTDVSLKWRQTVLAAVVKLLNCPESGVRIKQQDLSHLFFEFLFEIINQKVLEMQYFLYDFCILSPEVFKLSTWDRLNLINEQRKHVDDVGRRTNLQNFIVMLLD